MPIARNNVTLFNNFIKLNDKDLSLWAVGHSSGYVVMYQFPKENKSPSEKDIPIAGRPLITSADIASANLDIDYIKLSKARKMAISAVELPDEFLDTVRGVIFGQAVGDALGFGTEWISKSRVSELYPSGLHSYKQITRYGQLKNWTQGDWTDDTDQMLCIVDSIIGKKTVDIIDIAAHIHHWATTDGMGMGRTVYTAIHTPGFLNDPVGISKKIWEDSNHQWAANGGIMRTAPLGIWDFCSGDKVKRNAEIVCRITHADPRCTGSCVILSSTIRKFFLNGDKPDTSALLEDAIKIGNSFHPEIEVYLKKSSDSLEALDLDEGLNPFEEDRVGYTLKTLGAGFWALQHATSFEEGILKIIHEGGDADTNAAVAGAVLGAKFGYKTIPVDWLKGLVYRAELSEKVDVFAELAYRTVHT